MFPCIWITPKTKPNVNNAGRISQELAEKLVNKEYEKYDQRRLSLDVSDDFDDYIKKNRLDK